MGKRWYWTPKYPYRPEDPPTWTPVPVEKVEAAAERFYNVEWAKRALAQGHVSTDTGSYHIREEEPQP